MSPNIAFAVSQAARFSNDPKQSHASAVKTIVRYLVGTKDKGTIVTPTKKLDIKLYVNVDFAGLFKKEPDTDRNSHVHVPDIFCFSAAFLSFGKATFRLKSL
jgi:hypothetical protein